MPTPTHASPVTGTQIAQSHPRTEGASNATVGATVAIVSVAVTEPLVAGVAEAGFNKHVGARAGIDATEQVN